MNVIHSVEHCSRPDFAREKRLKGKRGLGLKYEKQAKEYLEQMFGDLFIPGPWFRYRDSSGSHYAQPDGLILDFSRGVVTIVEIKHSHTPEAWFQLTEKYEPLIRAWLGNSLWKFSLVELVKWYDPMTQFPVKVKLLKDLALAEPTDFNVHIFYRRTL